MRTTCLVSLLLLLFSLSVTSVAGQENNLDIRLEVSDPVTEGEGYTLTVHVQGNRGECTYMLFDKEPLSGAQPVITEKAKFGGEHQFINLSAGTYYVCVLDRKENMACKKTEVQ